MVIDIARGIKIEITEQLSMLAAETFAQWIGCYGVIWNCKVAENQEQYQAYRQACTNNTINAIKPKPDQKVAQFLTADRPWLKAVPSQIRRNAGTKFVEALNACLKGLRQAPKFKNKHAKKNCLVTNELFDVAIKGSEIYFAFKTSNKAAAFCALVMAKPEKMQTLPNMVWLTRKGSRYWLSFSYTATRDDIRAPQTIIDQLTQAPLAYQEAAVLGIDVGVVQPISMSNGATLGFTLDETKRLECKAARRLKYQRKLARQLKYAKQHKTATRKNYWKTKAKLAVQHANIANIRRNMAHRTTKIIAEAVPEVVVCERLAIKNMTKRPRAIQEPGTKKWLRNGASAKAGLNKSILNANWGRIQQYLEYKLRERDKLLVKIAPNYSSQECFACGFIDALNRKTQATFCCIICGYISNADSNAALVLKKRFINELNTGMFVVKTKTVKRIAIRKQKAARVAVSVCGAEVRPVDATGTG